MKRVISKSLIFMMGFLPFFLLAAEPDYILPTFEDERYFMVGGVRYENVSQWCDFDYSLRDKFNKQPLTNCLDNPVIPNIRHSWGYSFVWGSVSQNTFNNSADAFVLVELTPVCLDPNYQNGVDTDNLDGIDQCWPSSCPDDGIFWSNGNGVSTPTGSICVVNPISGTDCKYNAIENTDGSNSDFTFVQTGEGCACGNELVPCQDLSDGEVTNFPQGQDGCVAMGDSVFCQADPNVECSNGVCNPGCGYIGADFVCVESQIDPVQTEPCLAGDSRPSCAGVSDGDCPNGVINCGDSTPPETPPAPCEANDPRPECVGLSDGDIPDAGEGGATSDDISGLGDLLRQGNQNTKDIKDNTNKIAKALTDNHLTPDVDPDNNADWGDTKSAINQFTSAGDINSSEAQFKGDLAGQEGFFNTQVLGIVPTGGSCQNLTMNFSHVNVVIDACQYLVHAKIVIEWAMILAFFVYVRSAFNRLKPN